MKILPLTHLQVLSSAALHQESLPNDFLPSLGSGFLQILHSEFISSAYTSSWGAIDNNRLVGFVVGSQNPSQLMKSLVYKHFFELLPILLYKSLKKPQILKYLFQTLLYTKKPGHLQAELLIIIVHKNWQRKGVGKKLFLTLARRFKRLGVTSFKVGTLAGNNANNLFYQKMGGQYTYAADLYDKRWKYYLFTLAK